MNRSLLVLAFVLAGGSSPILEDAPGAPGAKATWTNGNKQGIGTSVTPASKVWFTLGDGAVNEIYYPTVDKAQTRLLELVVADGKGFLERETTGTEHQVRPLDGTSLTFEQVNTSRSGRYRIVKTVVSDPEGPIVLIRVRFEPKAPGLRLFVFVDPAVANSGLHDSGTAEADLLLAQEKDVAVAVAGYPGFTWTNTGYLGASDGMADLAAGRPLPSHRLSREGNVAQMAEIPVGDGQPTDVTLALAFAPRAEAAAQAARSSVSRFDSASRAYAEGWRAYVARLAPVDSRFADVYAMAAMVLRAHEDKTYRGAMIASLTIPWGDGVDASEPNVGGYHLVWSRDLYQVATAFLALGDREAAERALSYLFEVQQRRDGSFPQNSWLDGRPYWQSLQLDEVAFPLILAHELGRTDRATWQRHVRPAADFILAHGPATPQERWEEEGGYSPSTIAAEIAGLVCAGAIADRNGDARAAGRYRAKAEDWAARLEGWTVTRSGPLSPKPYFLRLSQRGTPDSDDPLEINNGGGTFGERSIIDAGFLELVRLGIRAADDPLVAASLEVVDRAIKVDASAGPAWYRYNHDGYGEKPDGSGYDGTGIGRLWPLLTGERGEYALAAGLDATPYLEALRGFANDGLMLPEQVWDRPDSPKPWLRLGSGTGSATPLAWTAAQYVRLARSIKEGRVLETPQVVADHFRRKTGRLPQ